MNDIIIIGSGGLAKEVYHLINLDPVMNMDI